MLFEPPIDLLVERVGCRYAAAVIVGARAKDLENKIPTLLNGSAFPLLSKTSYAA